MFCSTLRCLDLDNFCAKFISVNFLADFAYSLVSFYQLFLLYLTFCKIGLLLEFFC